ncbi:MAG TPA: BtpA/SgcQ family protein [Kiritimatiellia bacterium]|nr:BtpA/SgcQ family protein [Kiritimatiellia bacterium]
MKPPKQIIGMIHVPALPGTPGHALRVDAIVMSVKKEAELYRRLGVDGIMIENMHDVPYLKGSVGPEIVAMMTRVACAVKEVFRGAVGIQILAAANRSALAVAHAAGLDFIRAEGFVFAHVADEGLIESCAADVLRYRKQIGADRIQIWADIKKKHSSHAITADIGLAETAHAAEFMRADAVIITGGVTGDPPVVEDVLAARDGTRLPIMLGSGISHENLLKFWPHADGYIIGTAFKRDGDWRNPPDPGRIRRIMKEVKRLRMID